MIPEGYDWLFLLLSLFVAICIGEYFLWKKFSDICLEYNIGFRSFINWFPQLLSNGLICVWKGYTKHVFPFLLPVLVAVIIYFQYELSQRMGQINMQNEEEFMQNIQKLKTNISALMNVK